MKLSILCLGLVLGASASTVDPNTGIAFESYTSSKDYTFGIAVPESPGADFIGQLVIPTTGAGYGGIALGGQMEDDLLIVAWPNGKDVVASFRYTRVRASPSPYTSSSSLSMTPIASGTFVNGTHMSYTFVCSGCITNDAMTFSSNASTIQLGWSLADAAVDNPGSAEGASFVYHSVGDGTYSLDLEAARSAKYESWAAAAAGNGASASTSTASSTSTPASTPSSAPQTTGGSPTSATPSVAHTTTTSSSASSTTSGKPSGSSRLERSHWWMSLTIFMGIFVLSLY